MTYDPKLIKGKSPFQMIVTDKKFMIGLAIMAVIFFVICPLFMSSFRLNLLGKYLTYSFVALGLVMCWGYGGILSLGQGMFFGIGGYCMAMFLKLEASDPESTAIQTTPGIPDFMDWNQVTELPWFWYPFKSLGLTCGLILILPIIVSIIFSFFYFRGRVTGVVFAILTQSAVACIWYLIVGNQGYFGGINGITDLKTLNGWDIRSESAQTTLFMLTVFLLIAMIVICRFTLNSRLGRVLIAQRDQEERVRFSGYNITLFRIFVFAMAAVISSVGGALFTLQVGFMSPNLIGVTPSIDMVIFTAVGGRLSLFGAVIGAVSVNYARTAFSEAYPDLWVFLYGLVFILIVLYLPNGIAGLYEDKIKPLFTKYKNKEETPKDRKDAEGIPVANSKGESV
jgi:urea transport system permease protein